MRHAVIMAGGSGTRFWPQSRNRFPKQFLNLAGDSSMIQMTYARIASVVEQDHCWVVTNSEQSVIVRDQLSELNKNNVIIEPEPKNTAACIGLAAIRLLHEDEEATMLVVPSDHVIEDLEAFEDNVNAGFEFVEKNPDSIMLFGISPMYPSTGYGYIEKDDLISRTNGKYDTGIFQVSSFHEKPGKEKAVQYVASEQFYWNSGIFIWKAKQILELIQLLEPGVGDGLARIREAWGTPEEETTLRQEFSCMKSISIDHAVLEKSRKICRMMAARFDWDDLGTWQALRRLMSKDNQGNCIDANHSGMETGACIIRSTDPDHLIVTRGVNDLLIVHTPDATLIAAEHDEKSIREIVDYLRENGYDRYL